MRVERDGNTLRLQRPLSRLVKATVYFGGIGEAMFHQRTVARIAQVKRLGRASN